MINPKYKELYNRVCKALEELKKPKMKLKRANRIKLKLYKNLNQ